ncbi:MAG: MFS transporter [Thermoleophilia bacterium]
MLGSLRQLHWSIYALSLASAVIMTGFMMMLPILPLYASQLDFNEFEIGMLIAAFFLGRVPFQFPLGTVSDQVGRKLIMSASLLIFALATTAFTLTSDAGVMIALRLAQGIASAGFVVGFQSYVNDLTPRAFRGLAHGINSSAINAGVIIGPILGGTLSQAYSIQAPFWVGGALGAACFIISLTIPNVSKSGVAREPSRLKPAAERIRSLMASVLTLPSFSLSLVHFLQMMSMAIFFTTAPILTAELLTWSTADIAFALAAGGTAGAISSPFLGRLADRQGARVWVMVTGLAVMALQSYVIFIHPGTALTMLGFIIGGAGTPAYFNSFFSLVGDVTLKEERGAVSGFIGSTAEWGSILGSSLVTPLLWRSVGVRAPMAISVILLLITVLVSLMVKSLLQRRMARISEIETAPTESG